MSSETLSAIKESKRLSSPALTPQALAWHGGKLWMGSRDLCRIYAIDVKTWTVVDQMDAPGIPWAGPSTGEDLLFTIVEGPNDDRYLRLFRPGTGFSETERIACPEFTGSYLSSEGGQRRRSERGEERLV